jgi:hypothetical protein
MRTTYTLPPARPTVAAATLREVARTERQRGLRLAVIVAAATIAMLAVAPFARSQDAAAAAAPAPAVAAAPPEAAVTTPAAAADAPLDTRSIDEQSQALKKDAVDLNRELFMLEEELLFPANTQVAVYVSMDVGEFFAIDSVQLRVDDKEVANHLYTQREAEALLKGGVHRLYLGNVKVGPHEIVAIFTGKGPNAREYRRGATVKFEKAVGAKYLELKITDRQRRAQPEFEIRDWE